MQDRNFRLPSKAAVPGYYQMQRFNHVLVLHVTPLSAAARWPEFAPAAVAAAVADASLRLGESLPSLELPLPPATATAATTGTSSGSFEPAAAAAPVSPLLRRHQAPGPLRLVPPTTQAGTAQPGRAAATPTLDRSPPPPRPRPRALRRPRRAYNSWMFCNCGCLCCCRGRHGPASLAGRGPRPERARQ